MDGIDKIEDLYDTFDENVVNNYLIQQLLLYSLSTAISETIDYFESLQVIWCNKYQKRLGRTEKYPYL